jgi:hypothetical protein
LSLSCANLNLFLTKENLLFGVGDSGFDILCPGVSFALRNFPNVLGQLLDEVMVFGAPLDFLNNLEFFLIKVKWGHWGGADVLGAVKNYS